MHMVLNSKSVKWNKVRTLPAAQLPSLEANNIFSFLYILQIFYTFTSSNMCIFFFSLPLNASIL